MTPKTINPTLRRARGRQAISLSFPSANTIVAAGSEKETKARYDYREHLHTSLDRQTSWPASTIDERYGT
jgi:hypothetical protein